MKVAKFFICILVFVSVNLAQTTSKWTIYSDGNKVSAFADDNNYLWIGTWGGLVRLDKSNETMKFYNRSNSPMPSNAVSVITTDAFGNKWIGTNYLGVLKFSGDKWNLISSDSYSGDGNSPNAIMPDTHGNLWVGYQDGGLSVFNDSNHTDYHTWNSSLPSEHVYSIAIDKNGIVWVGTWGGLVKINGDTWTVYSPQNSGLPSYFVYSVAIDNQNNLWLATPDKGLIKFDGINWTVYNTNNSQITSNKVIDVVIDNSGNKWLAVSNTINTNIEYGLIKFDGSNWTIYDKNNSGIPGYYILRLFVDSSNNIWIGTYYGAVKFDGSNWKTYNTSNSGLSGSSMSLLIDHEQNVWIGTRGDGLIKFDGNNWQAFNISNSPIKSNNANPIYRTGDHSFWIGGQSDLAFFDGNNWTFYKDSSLPSLTSTCFTKDKSGNLWIGTEYYGLVKFDRTNFYTYDSSSYPLPDNKILSLLTDDNDNLWIGTKTGLVKFDRTNNKWITYNPTNSGLPGYGIKSLVMDANHTLWAAVPSYWNGSNWDKGGLAKYVNGGWQAISRNSSGLENKGINGLFIDNKNNKWVETSHGLVKFVKENEWEEFNIMNSRLASNRVYSVSEDTLGNLWILCGSFYTGTSLCIINEDNLVSVKENPNNKNVPDNFILSQNYPNPFNPTTTIEYSIPETGYIPSVQIKIYDILGREVATLVNEIQQPGNYSVQFNAANLSSGIYFYRLKAGDFMQTRKMILMK